MNAEILEAIKKSLPEHLSDTLKNELRELEIFRGNEKYHADERKELAELKSRADLYNNIETNKRTLEYERQKFEIEKRDIQIKLINEKYQDVIKLMDAVFRNQRLVHRTYGNETVPVKDQYGNTQYHNTSSNSQTDITEE